MRAIVPKPIDDRGGGGGGGGIEVVVVVVAAVRRVVRRGESRGRIVGLDKRRAVRGVETRRVIGRTMAQEEIWTASSTQWLGGVGEEEVEDGVTRKKLFRNLRSRIIGRWHVVSALFKLGTQTLCLYPRTRTVTQCK